MEKLNIICVDDQREVLSAVLQDLEPLCFWLNIEDCESASEALELMDELDANGEYVALVISDHVMPEKTGVELLTEISADARFTYTKKVLLTGQATHSDTINAINSAGINSINWYDDLDIELIIKFLTKNLNLEFELYSPNFDLKNSG